MYSTYLQSKELTYVWYEAMSFAGVYKLGEQPTVGERLE